MEKPLRIGVLAVQGNFREHATVLRRLGAEPVEVRLPEHLDGLDGLIIPGGESTAITRLMRLYGLDEALLGFGGPIFGTCAGMIVLDREHLGLADIRAARNAFGRQVHSFEADVDIGHGDEPLRAVFGNIPHQICEFHIIKELTKAILRAVAKVRKKLAERKLPAKRGRPATPEAKRTARKRERLKKKIADLFEHRHLFVQHDLTPAEHRTLQKITRGLPQLRALRDLMEEVYRLFDRRCRTDTALAKLAKLRQRVRRFKQVGKILTKLRSPNLDKALTFLDDKLLPSTSNAVERGNRRHRKMQKTVYRVRTQEHIHNRIALDMLRDSQKDERTKTIKVLHKARTS